MPFNVDTENSMESAVGLHNLSKYGCRKKPAPLPRTKPANRTPSQMAADDKIHGHFGPIRQEEGFSEHSPVLEPSLSPILPHEETACKPGVTKEDKDDSGIGHAGDWTGMSIVMCRAR